MAVRDQVTINNALEAFLAEERGRLAAKTLRRYEDVVCDFFGSKRPQADKCASDFKKLADEVLSPLGATPGVTLNVTIEIEGDNTRRI